MPEPPVIASLAADTERVRVYAAVPEDTVACRDCKPLPADDDESADSPRAAIRQELQEGEDRSWRDRGCLRSCGRSLPRSRAYERREIGWSGERHLYPRDGEGGMRSQG